MSAFDTVSFSLFLMAMQVSPNDLQEIFPANPQPPLAFAVY
jgi:hypothetical protein